MKCLIILFIAIFCCSCGAPERADTKKGDTVKKEVVKVTRYTYPQDTIVRVYHEVGIEQFPDAHTFFKCKLYERPDTSSTLITQINAFTPVKYLQTVYNYKTDTLKNGAVNTELVNSFHEVEVGEHKGYLLSKNLAQYIINDKAGNALYLLGVYYKNAKEDYRLRITKLKMPDKVLVTTFESKDYFPEALLDIYLVKGKPLKNVNRIIKIVAHADFCGGYDIDTFFADAGNHIVRLPQNYDSNDDGGGVYTSKVFMPRQNNAGNQVLQSKGTEHTGDSVMTLNPRLVPKLPDEIIAETLEEGAYVLNEQQDYIRLKNGNYKMAAPLSMSVKFYRWDGQKLIPLAAKKKTMLKNHEGVSDFYTPAK